MKLSDVRPLRAALVAGPLLLVASLPAAGAEFSVSPIRAELRAGALNESFTVTNYAATPLRVTVKLMEWTQDAEGKDVYRESSDLIYFPRQLELPPDARRLVRVGAKTPGATVERAYRLYFEDEPPPAPSTGRAQVAINFRFGVPVFLPPPNGAAVPEVTQPVLEKGRLSVTVRNTGNQHFRLSKVSFTDGAGFTRDVAGWYSLAGSTRQYATAVPPEICRSAKAFTITLEGEGLRLDRKLDADPARCQ